MTLHTTYPLADVLDSLSKASDNLYALVEEMKREGKYSIDCNRYVIDNALTTSPYARVTFTGKNAAGDIVGYKVFFHESFAAEKKRADLTVLQCRLTADEDKIAAVKLRLHAYTGDRQPEMLSVVILLIGIRPADNILDGEDSPSG